MTPAEPRPGLRDVDAYVSPQLDVPVRLNTNECPYPLPEGFAEDLAKAARELSLNRYPDGQAVELRRGLAAHAGHPFEGTWAANGSNEILFELLLAYGGPARRAVMFEPTYLLHSRLAWLTNTEVVWTRLDAPFVLSGDQVAYAREAGADVVFVCSPNNPTGNAQPVDVIEQLADAVPRALIIVDEAYVEFGGKTALGLVGHGSGNVVVVRTLSKAFALAGARVGYCLADPEVIADLQRVRLPYHLSSLTQAAGLTALRHTGEAMAILDDVRDQRDRLQDSLDAMPGVEVFPSEANFVLFRVPSSLGAKHVWRALLDRGVLVRDLTAVVPEGLRVTAGTTQEVDLFLKAMQEVLA